MDIPAYVLLSHEQALRRRMDVVANNLANVGTTGFKREQPLFHETVRTSEGEQEAGRSVSFVLDHGAVHDVAEGAFIATGNPLDLAIEGKGYFSVERSDGSTGYTRAGNFLLLDDGRIGTVGGLAVRGEDGRPITVPPEARAALRIGRDGSVEGPQGPLGRIAVTTFEDEGGVEPAGDGLFNASNGLPLAQSETRVRAGGLENSNVQPVAETTAMIEVLRAYQSSQRMGEALNDLRRRAIERLGSFR